MSVKTSLDPVTRGETHEFWSRPKLLFLLQRNSRHKYSSNKPLQNLTWPRSWRKNNLGKTRETTLKNLSLRETVYFFSFLRNSIDSAILLHLGEKYYFGSKGESYHKVDSGLNEAHRTKQLMCLQVLPWIVKMQIWHDINQGKKLIVRMLFELVQIGILSISRGVLENITLYQLVWSWVPLKTSLTLIWDHNCHKTKGFKLQ